MAATLLYINNSLHMARKYNWIFVQFLEQMMSADKYLCILGS